MKKVKTVIAFVLAVLFLAAFAAMTYGAVHYDVQGIGVNGSYVGYASINNAFHVRIVKAVSLVDGLSRIALLISEYLGFLAIVTCIGFGVVGICQWIGRKSLLKVDYRLWLLLGFYVFVAAVYLLFELVIINYRPVLIKGVPEASYPSSHTLLTICVMGSAMMQFSWLLRKAKPLAVILDVLCVCIMIIVPICRLIAGVHWLTDVVAGIVVSIGLLLLLRGFVLLFAKEPRKVKRHARHSR